MRLIVKKDYDQLSKKAADILIDEIKDNPNTVLGLATGSTTIGMYEEIIRRYNKNELDFSKVKSFNLDEYVGLEGIDPHSYRYFMDKYLFNHINIDKNNIYVPDGKAEDLKSYVKEYDALIDEAGGIDIQVLGIGTNGHIAFNEPARELSIGTSVVNLTENTIKDNSRFFKSLDDMPRTAISMGMGNILKARKILLLASGKNKREIMGRLLGNNTLTTYLPASLLLLHPNLTIIVDEEAYRG